MSTAKPWVWQSEDAPITKFDWIRSDGELAEFCQQLPQTAVALDTEFIRRTTFYPKLALIQAASGDGRWLIDPLEISDWSPLRELWQDRARIKVLHSVLEDLDVFRTHLSALPEPIFDTQAAAAFLGLGDSPSYAALVLKLFDVVVDKGETTSDWLQRPLTQSQIDYALMDVEWLQPAQEILATQLREQGKLEWAAAFSAQQVESMRAENDPLLAWQRLKGLNRLKPKERALAAHLATWRETRARELDKPRSWLMKDGAILELARVQPKSMRYLERDFDMSPESVRRYGHAIVQEIALALDSDMPEPAVAPALEGSQKNTLQSLQARVIHLAEERQMSSRLLASRNDLEQLILWRAGHQQVARPAMFDDWRYELLQETLQLEPL